MFYYYGAKRVLAPHYPRPRFRTVVEPFSGSAQYAVRCLMERTADRAILTDLDPRVVDMWQRLLDMSPEEIRGMADETPYVGELTFDPLVIVTAASNSWGGVKQVTMTERMAARFPLMCEFMATALPFLKGRVEISLGDYRTAEQSEPATYFIDPPYQTVRLRDGQESSGGARGKGYAKGCNSDALDFRALGEWCRSLNGHVIAVDQIGADWLPFKPLKGHRSSVGTMHLEAIWTSHEEQSDLLDLIGESA